MKTKLQKIENQLTPMEKLTVNYEQFGKGRNVIANGKENFSLALNKLSKSKKT